MKENKNEVIIKTEKLCKEFNNGEYNEYVIKNIDLEIYKSDFTVIMGPSGTGKSTLLYMLSAMDKVSFGNVFFLGEDISKKTDKEISTLRKKHFGFIFQQINLIETLSILDNVVICGLLTDKDHNRVLDKAKKMLLKVGIEEKIWNKYPYQISGGEAQRVAIIRSQINNPEIIFADEPTGALNSKYSNSVLNLITNINREGQSIILVTHDVKAAVRGNRIIYLHDGLIKGECNLSKYHDENQDERYKRLDDFLKDMGW